MIEEPEDKMQPDTYGGVADFNGVAPATGSAVPGDAGEARELPKFIRGWTAPFHVTSEGIKDDHGCWICSATNNKLAHELVELMNYAAALSPTPRMSGDTTVTDAMVEAASAAYAKATGYYVEFHKGLRSESSDKIRRGIRAALSVAPAPVGVKALTDAQIKDATTEYLSHRGERPYRILHGGQALWEVHMPAMQAAILSALTAGEPALPGGDVEPNYADWKNLSCDEQFALASRIAGNIGYDLFPEREEIDAPEPAVKTRDPELQACIDAASKAFRETFASPPPVAEPGWKLVPIEPNDAMAAACLEALRPNIGRGQLTLARIIWSAMLAASPQQEEKP